MCDCCRRKFTPKQFNSSLINLKVARITTKSKQKEGKSVRRTHSGEFLDELIGGGEGGQTDFLHGIKSPKQKNKKKVHKDHKRFIDLCVKMQLY